MKEFHKHNFLKKNNYKETSFFFFFSEEPRRKKYFLSEKKERKNGRETKWFIMGQAETCLRRGKRV